MPRAPFQVLVYPCRRLPDGLLLYALFHRSDTGWWQGIAGGGEDEELPEQAARREAFEEAGISGNYPFHRLTTVEPIPAAFFRDSRLWGDDVFVIPQYCFGVLVQNAGIELSPEHDEYRWLTYEEAQSMIHFDGNRTALWELHARLSGLKPYEIGVNGLI